MSAPVRVELDHLAYLQDRTHRRAVHAAIRRAVRKRRTGMFRVLHERDEACCSLERWATTAARVRSALAEDGERVGWLTIIEAGAA